MELYEENLILGRTSTSAEHSSPVEANPTKRAENTHANSNQISARSEMRHVIQPLKLNVALF